MYKDKIEFLKNAVANVHNDTLANVISNMEVTLQKLHRPTAAIVSDGYGAKTIIPFLNSLLENQPFDISCFTVGADPVCLHFVYGEPVESKEMITLKDRTGASHDLIKINVSLKAPILEKTEIIYYCGIDALWLSASVLSEYDRLFIVTNATMALPLSEKTLLKEIVIPFYGTERVYLMLHSMHLLNSDIDRANISATVENFCNKNQLMNLNESMEEVYRILNGYTSQENLNTLRAKTILLNGIAELEKNILSQLEASGEITSNLMDTINEIERSLGNMKVMANITIENKIDNMFATLRYHIINAAEDYSNDAYNSIEKRIKGTDKPNEEIVKVQPYLVKIWETFSREVEAKVSDEYQQISLQLEEDIKKDCGKLVRMLHIAGNDELLAELQNRIYESGIASSLNHAVATAQVSDLSERIEAEEVVLQKKKKITKGVFVASIALTLFHPVMGISGLIGSKIYEKNKLKPVMNDTEKSAVLSEIFDNCKEIQRSVTETLTSEIEKTSQQAKETAKNIYSQVLEDVSLHIKKLAFDLDLAKQNKENLVEIVNHTIPQIKASLV